MNRHAAYAAILWVVLTVVGEWLAFTGSLFPLAAAEEAHTIDEAFRFLLILGVPVATLVLAMLFYSVIRFRAAGETDQDGPPIRTHRGLTWLWFGVTSALAIYVIFNPGLKGLRELSANPNDPYYATAKLMWEKNNRPDLYDKTYKMQTAADYPCMKLTGKAVTDYSNASLIGIAFGIVNRKWDEALLEEIGLDPDKFPEPYPCDEVIGEVKDAVGLP